MWTRGSCPDTEIQVLPDLGVPVDRVSCPDTKIHVLPDLGVDVDRVSCPDMENQECCLIRDGQT